jgi:hypothetical protein
LQSKSEYRYWFNLRGKQTLRSYSPQSTDLDVMPADHIRFIRACGNYYETEAHILIAKRHVGERRDLRVEVVIDYLDADLDALLSPFPVVCPGEFVGEACPEFH